MQAQLWQVPHIEILYYITTCSARAVVVLVNIIVPCTRGALPDVLSLQTCMYHLKLRHLTQPAAEPCP